ncbi:MAG: AbrB/MazE/SpoVT family DNA-binding domain-containing protein [Desulfurococcales archaeon]|nr:AbrB/MazE/SpoVT family DNA-binding domain-containing protein [Desulfurococcales archaeon]
MAALQQGSEIRRVQRLGGSSLVVTIPKHWARRMSIGPGDEVAVIDEGDSLKIAPLTPASRKRRILRVKLNPAVLRLGPSRVASCAYIAGYAGVSLEWNPRSLRVDPSEVAEGLRANPLVGDVEVLPGRVVATFEPEEGGAAIHLKALGSILSGVLEGSREAGPEASRLESLAATVLREKSGEARIPTGLAILMPIVDLVLELAQAGGGDAAKTLADAVAELAGGASVGSVKRLTHAVELAEAAASKAREGSTREDGLVLALALAVRRAALAAVCEALASRDH